MIRELKEDGTELFLSSFSCERNQDIEDFLRHKAIEFAKQSISTTHVVLSKNAGGLQIAGYFALAIKNLFIDERNIPSSEWKRRVGRFGELYQDLKGYVIPTPLIAQLSKNDFSPISGDELIRLAFDKVAELQRNFSGKIVYLECSDEPKLIDFYKRNRFRKITSEKTDIRGEPLVQMICYLCE
ncbi:MAG: hypothetical protein LBS58_03930 [Coriobacteriales bacterium]|jgi:hypothetical protein|nr:hypothetical protein [Coriobacteriales bacterium]